jgi:hypothetical protein
MTQCALYGNTANEQRKDGIILLVEETQRRFSEKILLKLFLDK